MRLAIYSLLALAVGASAGLPWFPFPPLKKWVPPGFVTTNGNSFELNGRPFVSSERFLVVDVETLSSVLSQQYYVGSNSYVRYPHKEITKITIASLTTCSVPQWLPLLTTQDDVEKTFQGMKNRGIKVVRTWVGSC
jgi:mannan endo-1,4-beta-mannosidase